jgi:hypothetical protein
MNSVCLGTARTLMYPQGGHLWVFLNWALGFRDAGFDVIWLDMLEPRDDPSSVCGQLRELRERLAPWGLADRIAIVDVDGRDIGGEAGRLCLTAADAAACDLLFDLRYNLPHSFVRRFRTTALLDLDPIRVFFNTPSGAVTTSWRRTTAISRSAKTLMIRVSIRDSRGVPFSLAYTPTAGRISRGRPAQPLRL